MRTRVLLLLLVLVGPLAAQAIPLDASLLRLGSLPRHATRAQLAQRLGRPTSVGRPRYECGSNYVDGPGHTYYQLHYPQAVYIGNAAEGYALETIRFVPGGAVLRYGRATWDARTTLAAVQKLFGADARLDKQLVPGAVVVTIPIQIGHTKQLADQWAQLTFRRGRLVAYTTWEPC